MVDRMVTVIVPMGKKGIPPGTVRCLLFGNLNCQRRSSCYNSRMKQKYDVVCIGDVVMDAFITLKKEARVEWDAKDTKHEHPRLSDGIRRQDPVRVPHGGARGGNASNVAVGAARLGL